VSKLLNAKVIFIPLEEFNEFAFLADISRWDPVKICRTEHSAMQRNARFEHEALRNGKTIKNIFTNREIRQAADHLKGGNITHYRVIIGLIYC
jgi:hypothetical protein